MARTGYLRGAKVKMYDNTLSANNSKVSLLSRGVRAVGKVPFGRYKDTTPKINPKFRGIKPSADGKKYAPGAPMKMAQRVRTALKKKGLQTNYSK